MAMLSLLGVLHLEVRHGESFRQASKRRRWLIPLGVLGGSRKGEPVWMGCGFSFYGLPMCTLDLLSPRHATGFLSQPYPQALCLSSPLTSCPLPSPPLLSCPLPFSTYPSCFLLPLAPLSYSSLPSPTFSPPILLLHIP